MNTRPLKDYIQHDADCATRSTYTYRAGVMERHPDAICTCGLNEARAAEAQNPTAAQAEA